MAHAYELEMSEPSLSRCDCCGGLTVRLTRFVCRNGDAFAVYYATYSNRHPDAEVGMLVSLGEWGDAGHPSQRAAFYCRVRPVGDSYEVMLGDAARSIWCAADVMGVMLTREQALRHPWKATAFEVLDEAFQRDPSLRGFLHRVQCGDAALPLERSFHAPDDIFALDEEAKRLADVGRSFASLAGERFFVRCLLPFPVEGYDAFTVGLWVEISSADFDRVKEAWDEPAAYSGLRFSGRIANDVHADLDLPVHLGTPVELHVPDPEAPPQVDPRTSGSLDELMSKPWPREAFEAYAVARGLL